MKTKTRTCIRCGIVFLLPKPLSGYSFSSARNCCACRQAGNEEASFLVGQKTKGQLFDERGNFQSARTAIAKDARVSFRKSKRPRSCEICGYDKHVQVCHIIAVKEFDDSTLISKINEPSNLVALCPNHHWEFDHDLLDIQGKELA